MNRWYFPSTAPDGPCAAHGVRGSCGACLLEAALAAALFGTGGQRPDQPAVPATSSA